MMGYDFEFVKRVWLDEMRLNGEQNGWTSADTFAFLYPPLRYSHTYTHRVFFIFFLKEMKKG